MPRKPRTGLDLNVCSYTLPLMARTAGSHSDITGPRVHATALRLFAQHGYAAVSMRQIARDVGVQAGALYNYIADKQTLLFSLLKGHMDDLLIARANQSKPDDPHDALRAFVDFHIAWHLDRPEAVFISYMELRNLEPAHFDVIEAQRRRYEDELEAILLRGARSGHFDVADTKVATLAVIGMLTGVNIWYSSEGRLSLAEVQAIYWDMVRKAVTPAP